MFAAPWDFPFPTRPGSNGEVTQAAGLHHLSKSNLSLTWRVNLRVQAFGSVDLMIISSAPQSEMLKQRPLQRL